MTSTANTLMTDEECGQVLLTFIPQVNSFHKANITKKSTIDTAFDAIINNHAFLKKHNNNIDKSKIIYELLIHAGIFTEPATNDATTNALLKTMATMYLHVPIDIFVKFLVDHKVFTSKFTKFTMPNTIESCAYMITMVDAVLLLHTASRLTDAPATTTATITTSATPIVTTNTVPAPTPDVTTNKTTSVSTTSSTASKSVTTTSTTSVTPPTNRTTSVTTTSSTASKPVTTTSAASASKPVTTTSSTASRKDTAEAELDFDAIVPSTASKNTPKPKPTTFVSAFGPKNNSAPPVMVAAFAPSSSNNNHPLFGFSLPTGSMFGQPASNNHPLFSSNSSGTSNKQNVIYIDHAAPSNKRAGPETSSSSSSSAKKPRNDHQ